MRFAVAASRLATTVTLGVVMTLGVAVPVGATTQIGALVCGADSHASLMVTAPPSDSVVAQPVVTLQGTAMQASEVSTTIDGAYDQTVALATGQENFSLTITLGEGTHTIQVTAPDVCGKQDAQVQLVLTYQPAVSSMGQQVSTEPSGGVVVGPQADVSSSMPTAGGTPSPWSTITAPLQAAANALDLGTSRNATPLQQASRVILVSTGLAIVVFGAATPWIGSAQLVFAGSKLSLAGVVPRMIGLILLALGLLL